MLDPAFWTGKRVLLTGHTGFKGSWLLLWLQALGAQVWTFALEPEPAPNLFRALSTACPPGEGWHHAIGNLADLNALKSVVEQAQPEVVLHLAAQPLVRRSGNENDNTDCFLVKNLTTYGEVCYGYGKYSNNTI